MQLRAVNLGRLGFGVLAAAALGVQGYHVCTQHASVVNFFSYFTNLSNMAGVVVLLVGGMQGLRGRRGVPDGVRGAVVLYMTVTGVIYAVLLEGYHLPLALGWVNDVVHKLMPAVYIADWLLVPPARRLGYRSVLGWMVFPFAYLTYSLVRGPIADWYAYPFLDPRRPRGYERVTVACLMITMLFAGAASAIVWVGNRRGAGRSAGPAVTTVS
jgi:hypothetical protein